MADRRSGNYGLRRAAPKKINQDFAYFGLRRDEPECKRAKESEESHIEILSSPDGKKGRGRPRKIDPSLPETPKIENFKVTMNDEDDESSTVVIDQLMGEEENEEDVQMEEIVEHTEQIIPYETSEEFILNGPDGETIQIIDFPIHLDNLDGSSKKLDLDSAGVEINEERIECTECHKVLKPSSYRQHLKTHLGSKPHACELCPARFTRRGDVERHIRIVHKKVKPFKCHKCPRAFGDKKNLRWHLMNHDKKLFHVCETCGFKFGKKDYYDNHVKFIHPLPQEDEDEEEDDEEFLLDSQDNVGDAQESINLFSPNKQSAEPSSFSKPKRSSSFDLSNTQLLTILEQNQGRRITIVGPEGDIKYLSVTPKEQINVLPQVVNMETLEKITKLSCQQIAKLHAPTEEFVDHDKLKAVVIEVADSEEVPVEEIFVGQGNDCAEEAASASMDNTNLIEVLLGAAETSVK